MITVIIPAYKRQDCLREALDSLVGQTEKNFEVIVVDDHSPEPLEGVVNEYKEKLNISYIYAKENGGPGAARQLGLEECYSRGTKYVTFLDSDDLFFPHTIERLLHEISNTNCDFISACIWQEIGGHLGNKIENKNQTWLHGKVFSVEYLQKKKITFPKIRTNEDVTFNLLVTECAEKKGYLDETLYLFRYANDSLTKGTTRNVDMISIDYIGAIYHTAKYMQDNYGGITDQVLIDIFATYNHYQTGNAKGIITEETNKQINYMLHLPAFVEALNNLDSMQRLQGVINQYEIFGSEVIYFGQTFFEWLTSFGFSFGEVNNEDSNN